MLLPPPLPSLVSPLITDFGASWYLGTTSMNALADASSMTLEQRNVHGYGTGDDGSLDTTTIQAALDGCAGRGGEVYLPPGTCHNAPPRVGDDTISGLVNGAELRFIRDFTEFPTVESRWEGWDQDGFHPYLHVTNASNVTITDEGVIDGGDSYW